MSIQLECHSCGRTIKAKEEYAGRKLRCPNCQKVITVPRGDEDFAEEYEDDDAGFRKRPSSSASKRRGKRSAEKKQKSAGKDRSWFVRNWHWAMIAAMLLAALWPKIGLGLAFVIACVGGTVTAIVGIIAFLGIIIKDPGTFLLMLVSRSARFEMMRQPDDHPYKKLVGTALVPFCAVFWKGVLVMVMFIPAMAVQAGAFQVFNFFKKQGKAAAPVAVQNPNLRRAGRVRPHRPGVPNRDPHPVVGGDPAGNGNPVGGGNAGGGFAPQGFRAGRDPASQPAAAADRIFYVTVTYGSFKGPGSMEDTVRAALKGLSGYVEDSLDIDEEAKAVRFQHRGQIPPPDGGKMFKHLAQNGFVSPRMRVSTKAAE